MLFAFFYDKELECLVDTGVFFTCMTSGSQKQTSQKRRYLQFFDKTLCKKLLFRNNVSHFFSSWSAIQKAIIVCSLFATAHPPPERVRSHEIAKLFLKWTFCLSQSLLQSSNSKNWGGFLGPKIAEITMFYEHTVRLANKKVPPPQLKLTCC